MPADDWLTLKDAMQRLGISRDLCYRLIDEGGLPAYKIGRVIRLRENDVESFLETCRVVPGTIGHLSSGESRTREPGDASRYR